MLNKPFALFLLVILSPIFLLNAVFIFIEDGIPIFFKQKRVGINYSFFEIYKFRSMKKNTPNVATHLLINPDQYLLKIGKFIRKTSLDELPNLINIIKGEKATEYGIEGKNGVILIQSKFITPPPPPSIAPPPPPVEVVSVVGKGAIINNRGKTPLYVINGLPVQKNSNNPLQNMNPNDIESISILKDKSAVSLYGKEGEDGVVLITTKSGISSGIKSTIKTGYKIDAQEFVNNVPTVVNVANYQKNVTRIKPAQYTGGDDTSVKYIKENLNNNLPLDRGGPEAKKMFGEKNKNGVIFISTKWQEKN